MTVALAAAFALLAGFYAVVTYGSRSTPVARELPGDVPSALALTGTEQLSATSRDRRFGDKSLSVTLPATFGAQGIYVQRAAGGGLLFMGKFWFKGRRGAQFLALLTQQDGIHRSRMFSWRATGAWEDHVVVGLLHPLDRVVNLVVKRADRRGREAFDIDGVTIAPWLFGKDGEPAAHKLVGSEKLVNVPAQTGPSSLRVQLPSQRGTQGVKLPERKVAGQVTLSGSVWFRGERNKTYVLSVLQQRGVQRAFATWTATGDWELRRFVAPMEAGDTQATVVLQRTDRGGPEAFELSGLRMEAWRFENGDASPLHPLTGHERVSEDAEAVLGGSSTRVDVPAHRSGGVYIGESELAGPGVFVCSAWVKGTKGSTYRLLVTRPDGTLIAQGKPWKDTGTWERRTLTARLRRQDRSLNFVVSQSPRSVRGTFNVDAVDIEPRAAPTIARSG